MVRKNIFIMFILFFAFSTFFGTANLNTAEQVEKNPPEMVVVKAGEFMMGEKDDVAFALENEKPAHKVKITYDYLIGKYEITNSQLADFFDTIVIDEKGKHDGNYFVYNNSKFYEFNEQDGNFKRDITGIENRPAVEVSWWAATAYCNWLSRLESLPIAYDEKGNLLDENGDITWDITKVVGYRLPTEAEWEYAARGITADNTSGLENKYSGSDNLDEVGWYWDNSVEDKINTPPIREAVKAVGQKNPNAIGIHDMSGNVWEWCQDCWDATYYERSPDVNPVNLVKTNANRVIRGGALTNVDVYCRVSARGYGKPFGAKWNAGFRIAKKQD